MNGHEKHLLAARKERALLQLAYSVCDADDYVNRRRDKAIYALQQKRTILNRKVRLLVHQPMDAIQRKRLLIRLAQILYDLNRLHHDMKNRDNISLGDRLGIKKFQRVSANRENQWHGRFVIIHWDNGGRAVKRRGYNEFNGFRCHGRDIYQ